MAGENLAEQVAEVRRHREVAPLEAARRVETRPAPEHTPAVHGSAHHQHRGGVAMVGANVAVLADRAAELGHREHHDVAQPVPEVPGERREPLTQLGEARGQLPLAPALVDVRVPPGDVRERHLQAQVPLDELRDLLQRPPQPAPRVLRVVRRPILRRIRLPQQLYRLEGFLRGRRQQARRRAGVQLFEGAGEAVARRSLGRAQPERLQVVDRERRGRPREDAGELRSERDRAERRVVVLPVVPAVAVEPAVRGGLHPRRARLHVVLRVEVAARGVGRADGVDHAEALVVP